MIPQTDHVSPWVASRVASDAAIVVCAPDGHILYASPWVEFVLEHSPVEMVGRPWTDFVHPTCVADAHLSWSRGVAPGEPQYVRDVCLLRADGSVRHVEIVVTDLRRVPGVAGLVLDLHECAGSEAWRTMTPLGVAAMSLSPIATVAPVGI